MSRSMSLLKSFSSNNSFSATCATLLATLVKDFPDRVDVRMFHTPNLTGRKWLLIPSRINEGWGLQHMKLYSFDNEIIMSG